jgi:hypothetical protein
MASSSLAAIRWAYAATSCSFAGEDEQVASCGMVLGESREA